MESMKKNRKQLIYNLLAAGIFVLLLAMSGIVRVQSMEQNDEEQEVSTDVVIMGDSIYGMTRDETSVAVKLEMLLCENVFNGALGGTCMGRLEENRGSSYVKDAFSMVSLSKAIVSGDFRIQEHTEITENGTEYFPETIAALKEIDFSKVEILFISHCVNDYHSGEVIYGEEAEDEHTYAGALRSTLVMLKKAYPKLRIILLTPPFTWYTEQGLTCEEYVLGGNVLEDYIDAQYAVAEEMDVELIDLYHDLFPHETWDDWQRYSVDGLHPNEAGRELIAQTIAAYLTEHPAP